jgi:hypothetical protein
MGVGPTEGPSRATPPHRIDTKSGPASAAPVTEKPLATNVTAGNLAPPKSPAKIKELDAAITRDLAAVRKAEAAIDEAAWKMGRNANDGPRTRAFESAEDTLDTAKARLDKHVKLALAARLPKFDRQFDRSAREIARAMKIQHGGGHEISNAINNAEIELEAKLSVDQRAAVITERILTNNPPKTGFLALNSVYRDKVFKAEIRKDPGYQQIIDAKVQDCFVGKGGQKLKSDDVLANVHDVIESKNTHSDIKQDFLNAVLRHAEDQRPDLDLEIKVLHATVLGVPM